MQCTRPKKKKKKNRFPGNLQATLARKRVGELKVFTSPFSPQSPVSDPALRQTPGATSLPSQHCSSCSHRSSPPNFPSPAGSLLYLSPSCSRQPLLWGASGHPRQGNRKANSRASPLPLFLWVWSPQASSPAPEQNSYCDLPFLSAASPRYRTDLPPHFLTLCPYLLDKTAAYIDGKEFCELHVW